MKWILLLSLMGTCSLTRAQYFEQVGDSPINSSGGASRSAAFVDVDGDGFLDVFISNGPESGQDNTLYMNQGDGTFSDNVSSPITSDDSPSDGATWGDVDNDGDLDLYVANWWGKQNLFYLNDGAGNFTKKEDRTLTRGTYSETASWADFNKDGYLDLYVTNSSLNFTGAGNNLATSDGDGRYTDNSANPIVIPRQDSRSINWVDYDNDGDLDLFISNENNDTNILYRNDEGVFHALENAPIVTNRASSMGSSWADYDNDGDLDLFVANYNANARFYRNEGNDVFNPVTNNLTSQTGYSFGTAWGDIDNDGDLDLFVANAFKTNPREKVENFLYINEGNDLFTKVDNDVVATDLGWTYGAAMGDYDNDGFLDLVTARTDGPENNVLYHNLGNDNNWVNISLEGVVSNGSAIGAKVRIKATIGGETIWQMREVSSQSGYNCQNSLRVHFGLGAATKIDSLIVEWPLGEKDYYKDIDANQFLKYQEEIPEGFVRANFKLERLDYPSGELIQFVNLSVVDPNLETTYSWDFDGDGAEDSALAEPEFSYDSEGMYDVSLIVSNGMNADTRTRASYVEIDDNVTTGLSNALRAGIAVYPNPFEHSITIDDRAVNGEIEFIKMTDLMGKTIAVTQDEQLMTDGLETGIYILHISMDTGVTYSQKVLKK